MRGICIHAHFYQPPREDPWLDDVLLDPSAAPAHDWNRRIDEECYRPNRAARLVDGEGRIVLIVNNYRHLSFNVGPTLHRWIVRHDPTLNHHLIEADRFSLEATGAGNAVAQAYNHMILPLSTGRDKHTQIRWGMADFRSRFGRDPGGMWLPETAVDTPTLEALAQNGIRFTILAPSQCAAVCPPGGTWSPTPGGQGLDVTRPYRVVLPSGRSLTLVFYQGDIAQQIAFGGLLDNGDRFAEHLIRSTPGEDGPRLLVVATDGETYGHHHSFGEMALARAFQRLSEQREVLVTNVDAFLRQHPATWECRIAENTSWSCAHGVERWRSDCGCHTGGEPGWHQAWRGPLRDALDRLRDRIDELYEERVGAYCDAPWALRDQAVELYLDSPKNLGAPKATREGFLARHCPGLDPEASRLVLTLLEAQKLRLFMYTSCGWFFNDVAGLETQQILGYALRAAEQVRSVTGVDLEPPLLRDLEEARGNCPDLPNGRAVLERKMLPRRRSLEDLAATAALLDTSGAYYAFFVRSATRTLPSGDLALRVSDLEITDARTGASWSGSAAVLSSGGIDDVCRLSPAPLGDEETLRRGFYRKDLISLGSFLEEHFPLGPWHLDVLAPDDRLMVAGERTRHAELRHMDTAQDILTANWRLLVQLHDIGTPPPAFLEAASTLVFRERLAGMARQVSHVLDLLEPDSPLLTLLEEAHSMGLAPELSLFAPRLAEGFHDELHRLRTAPDEKILDRLLRLWRVARDLDIPVNPWRLQNEIWRSLERAEERTARRWLPLARELGFATPQP